MTYPSQPDFTSISDTDAWWIISTPDGSAIAAICSMGGRAFVDLTQMILGLPSNGVWDASVSSALVAALRSSGASGSLINAISGEAAARRVGTNSVKGAIFLMHRGQSFGGGVPLSVDEGRIGVGPSTVTPQWGVAAPPSPNGDMPPACVPAGTPVQVPAPPGQPIPSVDVTVPPYMPPQTPYLPPPTTGPGKPVITPAAGGSSGLILGLVAVAAVGGVAWYAMKKPKANPKKTMHAFGYSFDVGEKTRVHRERIETQHTGDYGADPIGDGTFRMVPSGDIVSFEERNKRLARKNPSGGIDLSSIKTIYRDANLALWGIPYKMRSEVGQQPRDLDRARNTKGWVYLGSPGWWGTISREDQAAIKEWLAGIDVPGSWYEWGYVEDLRK